MNFDKIFKDLKEKKYSPIYFLMGDEAYYIDIITNYIIENVLSKNDKEFNLSILYGKDIDIFSLIATARRFPMMAKYQIVIVKEAQNLKKIENLISYVDKVQKSTIMVINYKYKTIDKRKKLYKKLKKNFIIFDSKKLYDNQIPSWIENFLKKKKCKISPTASLLLTEFLGTELSKIANEIEKLILTLPKNQSEITTEHIEKNTGISKDFNNFELHKAMVKKDFLKSNRIVNFFANNQKSNPFVLTISSLYIFFSKILIYHYVSHKGDRAIASALKINPFFVSDYHHASKTFNINKVGKIISFLREYDLKSKGVGNISVKEGELLKELVFKILH